MSKLPGIPVFSFSWSIQRMKASAFSRSQEPESPHISARRESFDSTEAPEISHDGVISQPWPAREERRIGLEGMSYGMHISDASPRKGPSPQGKQLPCIFWRAFISSPSLYAAYKLSWISFTAFSA